MGLLTNVVQVLILPQIILIFCGLQSKNLQHSNKDLLRQLFNVKWNSQKLNNYIDKNIKNICYFFFQKKEVKLQTIFINKKSDYFLQDEDDDEH